MTTTPPTPPAQPGGLRDLEREIALLERDFTPLKQDYGRLFELVTDMRDSRARASNDEECVMAFIRLGNEAAKLLASLSGTESEVKNGS